MGKILLISLLLLTKVTFSQVIEGFNDGDFSQNPIWLGDVNYFSVNPQFQLQSAGLNAASQNLQLSTANQLALNVSWTFFVQLNFNPSTTNFLRVYLMASEQNLKASLNGYFIQIGETGDLDAIHLFRQQGQTTTKIWSGSTRARVNNEVYKATIKVTRDALGNWVVYSDPEGGANFSVEGNVVDQTFTYTNYFGIAYKYATAARYNQFILDDLEIDFLVEDVVAPTIKQVKVVDKGQLEISFSESVQAETALNPQNYQLSPALRQPLSIQAKPNSNAYLLNFEEDIPTQAYTLVVNHIKDIKGNIIAANASNNFFYIQPYQPKQGEVLLNEIMANPSSTPNLPAKEYIELYNTTNKYLLTKGWKYSDLSSTYTFLSDTIQPFEYVILCAKADTLLFKPFGKVIGISPWPSLNNDKDVLTLKTMDGAIVDQVAYHESWYKDQIHKKAGYSLERIDPHNICKGSQNWMATQEESGGTPGKRNSVFQNQMQTTLPQLLSATWLDEKSITLNFSKMIDSLSASISANYVVGNYLGQLLAAKVLGPRFTSVTLIFDQVFQTGQNYTIQVRNVTDCAGQLMDENAHAVQLFLPENIVQGGLLLSELLFNPKPNEVDFVEVFNASKAAIDLKEIQLANVDAMGNIANKKSLSAQSVFILPGQYWVLTTKPEIIKLSYPTAYPQQLLEMESLPSFNNDRGTVILMNNDQVLDRFDYNTKMHNVLLQIVDGVSLERISFEKEANAPNNFTSAAANYGFATPTSKNSQQLNVENAVRLVSPTFSPDGDGFEDYLQLEYTWTQPNQIANLNVYNERGQRVKQLIKNQNIGTSGSLTWDGLDDNGTICKIGIYVLVWEVFDLNGKNKRYKNTCVLARKLD